MPHRQQRDPPSILLHLPLPRLPQRSHLETMGTSSISSFASPLDSSQATFTTMARHGPKHNQTVASFPAPSSPSHLHPHPNWILRFISTLPSHNSSLRSPHRQPSLRHQPHRVFPDTPASSPPHSQTGSFSTPTTNPRFFVIPPLQSKMGIRPTQARSLNY